MGNFVCFIRSFLKLVYLIFQTQLRINAWLEYLKRFDLKFVDTSPIQILSFLVLYIYYVYKVSAFS